MDPALMSSDNLLAILGVAIGVMGGIVLLGLFVTPRLLLIYQSAIRDLDTKAQTLEARLERVERRAVRLEQFIQEDIFLALKEMDGGPALVAVLRARLRETLQAEERERHQER